MKKKRCIIGGVCLFTVLAVLLLFLPRGENIPAPSPALLAAAEGLDAYRVQLKLDDQKHTLSITQEVQIKNRTDALWPDVVLRLWPNAFQTEDASPAALDELYDACYPNGFSPGRVLVHDVKWNGVPAAHTFPDAMQTVLSVDVGGLAPGEEGVLYIRCVVEIPNCAHRTGYCGGTYHLGNVLPLLSVYENGAWRQDAYSPIGDPFYHECANFSITLHLPEGFTPACSLPLQQETEGVWTGSGLALRDVGLAVSNEWGGTASAALGQVRVQAFAETKSGAHTALKYAQKALETYESLYGPYPYQTFTLCSAAFAPGGMEYPAMAVMDAAYFAPDQKDTLELLIAHETAHQWFYALVGSDPVNQPWQDEALCEWALLRYTERQHGRQAAENLRYYRVDAPMQEFIPGGLTPASPLSYFSSLGDYRSIVYGRGAALLVALDAFLPEGTDAFLQQYVQEYAFQIAGRTGFEQALNACAGMDALPLVQDYLDTKMME